MGLVMLIVDKTTRPDMNIGCAVCGRRGVTQTVLLRSMDVTVAVVQLCADEQIVPMLGEHLRSAVRYVPAQTPMVVIQYKTASGQLLLEKGNLWNMHAVFAEAAERFKIPGVEEDYVALIGDSREDDWDKEVPDARDVEFVLKNQGNVTVTYEGQTREVMLWERDRLTGLVKRAIGEGLQLPEDWEESLGLTVDGRSAVGHTPFSSKNITGQIKPGVTIALIPIALWKVKRT